MWFIPINGMIKYVFSIWFSFYWLTSLLSGQLLQLLLALLLYATSIRCTFRFRFRNANLLPIHFRYDLNFIFLFEFTFTFSILFYYWLCIFPPILSHCSCPIQHSIPFSIRHSFCHWVFQFREISNGFHAWITSISMVTTPNEHFLQFNWHEPFKMSFCYAFYLHYAIVIGYRLSGLFFANLYSTMKENNF